MAKYQGFFLAGSLISSMLAISFKDIERMAI